MSILDAFSVARKQLQHHHQKIRDVKTHALSAHGRIIVLQPENDCGCVRSTDGHEVWFHRSSVLNRAFEQLQIGDEVRFDKTTGDSDS